METVYIIGIITVAVVIVVVVWLLRDRIIGGRFGASATEQKIEAEITAASPQEEAAAPSPTPPPPGKVARGGYFRQCDDWRSGCACLA